MANFQELSNLVWKVADDVLRGLFKQHEYGDMTLSFSNEHLLQPNQHWIYYPTSCKPSTMPTKLISPKKIKSILILSDRRYSKTKNCG